MKLNNNQQAFLALVRGGLWETEVQLLQYGELDFKEIYRLAQEQSVVGLVAAGLEHVSDTKLPKEDVLTFAVEALQLEQRNNAMNDFIGILVEEMQENGVNAFLVKGQGVAQCYERPLWRASGDVDFLLDESNYYKAKEFLLQRASSTGGEDEFRKQIGMSIGPWEVELHGTLRGELWKKLDSEIDLVCKDCFENVKNRVWRNDKVDISIPNPTNDVFIVYTHILQHYFKEGVGLRQVCDWCRLLFTFSEKIDKIIFKKRLLDSGIMSEWQVFAALAINFLGAPANSFFYYKPTASRNNKAKLLLDIIFKTGNMGHNRDYSYRYKYPFFLIKIISVFKYLFNALGHIRIFPIDSVKSFGSIMLSGFKSTIIKLNTNS